MYTNHYKGEGYSWGCSHHVTRSLTVRVSPDELKMLALLYPQKTASYAVRSLIHEAYELQEKCKTKDTGRECKTK